MLQDIKTMTKKELYAENRSFGISLSTLHKLPELDPDLIPKLQTRMAEIKIELNTRSLKC